MLSYVPKYRWYNIELVDALPVNLNMAYEYMISLKQGLIQPGGLLYIYDSVAKYILNPL